MNFGKAVCVLVLLGAIFSAGASPAFALGNDRASTWNGRSADEGDQMYGAKKYSMPPGFSSPQVEAAPNGDLKSPYAPYYHPSR